MTVTLYAHRLSQPSRTVEILLRELDVPYHWQEIDFANGQTREPWFAQGINALRTIPALAVSVDENGDGEPAFTLGESHAILHYLCRTARDRSIAGKWYPGDHDAARAAQVDLWMAWHHNNVRRYDMFHAIMNLHLTLPMLKYELQSTVLKPLQDSLKTALATLEQHLQRQNGDDAPAPTMCGGEHPTLADLTIACELYQIVAVGYRFERYPQVAGWLDAMAQRPHFKNVSHEITEQGRAIRDASGGYLDLASAFA
jgi:glutathione S-transferase